jgi:DNA repair exonuclease SbcCD nuclease subunit
MNIARYVEVLLKTVLYKFIGMADTHFRINAPENRVDNCALTLKRKFAWTLKTAKEKDADILAAGDIFETAFQPYRLVRDYVEMLQRYSVRFMAVFGQHDLKYHSYKSKDDTPLSVLLTAIKSHDFTDTPYKVHDKVAIHGCSWGQPMPVPIPGIFNILLIHTMVTESGALWPGHADFVTGTDLIKTSGFNITLSGDNHQSFMTERNGAFLFNTGSLLRSSIAQYDHQPRVPFITIWDDFSVDWEWLDVPIKSAVEVFKQQQQDTTPLEEALPGIAAFLDSIANYSVTTPDFDQVYGTVIKGTEDEELRSTLELILLRATKGVAHVK